jgi:hypothetical protein
MLERERVLSCLVLPVLPTRCSGWSPCPPSHSPPKSHLHRGPPGHMVTNGFSVWVARPREHIPSCIVIRQAARHSTTTLAFPYLGGAVPRVPGSCDGRSIVDDLSLVGGKKNNTDGHQAPGGEASHTPPSNNPLCPSTGWSPHPRTMPFPAREWAGRVRLAPATFCCGGGDGSESTKRESLPLCPPCRALLRSRQSVSCPVLALRERLLLLVL